MNTQKLSPAQQRVIDALLDTQNIAESAQRVGIEEEELMQWMGTDSVFIVAFSNTAAIRRDEAFQDLMAPLQWEWSD